MIVDSTVQILDPFPAFPPELIREEISQPRTPIAEALGAGPIHRTFIEMLPADWREDPEVQIFSRVLWLKAGWYPLTPHYHFDWGGDQESAPVLTRMVCVGDASRTEFILGPLEYPDEPGERGFRTRWDAQVEDGLRTGRLQSWRIEPDRIVQMDGRTLHRARPADTTGFRLFLRAIRGLPRREAGEGGRYGNPGRFATCRNGFIPETDDERARYAPYSDDTRGPRWATAKRS